LLLGPILLLAASQGEPSNSQTSSLLTLRLLSCLLGCVLL
jgi:hypothetical protein